MDKSFLQKCWNDKRWRSLMILLVWILGLAILFVLLTLPTAFQSTNSDKEKLKETVKANTTPILNYSEKLNNLVTKDYTFEYFITTKTGISHYEGKKENDIIYGYKEEESGITKYKIENQKAYQILLDREIEITNLYENIDASLLDLTYLLGILNQANENDIIVTEEEKTVTYSYNLMQGEEELEIVVTEGEDAIQAIQIERDEEIYTLFYKPL